MTVASMATRAVDSMIPIRTGPRSDRKPTPDPAACCAVTAPTLGRRGPDAARRSAELLADELEERVQCRRRAVVPPGEPHGYRRRVADRPVDHPRSTVLSGGGLRRDADGLAGRDHGEPVL